MELRIEGLLPEGSSVFVTCCGETKMVNSLNKQALFNTFGRDDVDVLIEEEDSAKNYSLVHVILFLLTVLVQGVFNILFMNVGGGWYRKVRAFSVRAKLSIQTRRDTRIQFKISDTKYVGGDDIWEYPTFTSDPSVSLEILFRKNQQSILNEFSAYVKRVISVAVVSISIFLLLLFVSIANSIVAGIIATCALLVCILILASWLIIKEQRRCKMLFKQFSKK